MTLTAIHISFIFAKLGECKYDFNGDLDLPDSVGLASDGVDKFPYAKIATTDGKVAAYSGFFLMIELSYPNDPIYQVPYRSIVPNEDEFTNLIVPVAVSSSHIANASLTMEPVFMTLGAASMAVSLGVAVQDVPYDRLRTILIAEFIKTDRPENNNKGDGKRRKRIITNKNLGDSLLFPPLSG
jgi:hypothetical protein